MNKEEIHKFLSISSEETKQKFLEKLPISKSDTIDNTNLAVWGVIKEQDKEQLSNLWLGKELDKETRNYVKEISVKLIRVLSSISESFNKSNIDEKIIEHLSTSGVALEYFVLDKLIRKNTKKNTYFTFSKGPIEFDRHKIDFLSTFNNINFSNQLTTTGSAGINKKESHMQQLRAKIDKRNLKLTKSKFSIKQIPDLPVLFIINSKIGTEVNKGVGSKENILKDSYLKWEKEGFKNGGPSEYLDYSIKQELDIIAINYTKIVSLFMNFTKQVNLDIPLNEIIESKKGIISIDYNSRRKEYKASFFQNTKKGTNFIFSLNFYITEKFMNKQKDSGL